jgi:PhzF family phenazine biosynthesis protein
MQKVAREMRRYKTAFIERTPSLLQLKCFTPTVEMEVSGSAIVAAAHILWETGELKRDDEAEFVTKMGKIRARSNEELVEVGFRAVPETPIDGGEVERAFGVNADYAGVGPGGICIIEVGSDRVLRELRPDVEALGSVPFRSVVITCKSSSSEFDIASRVFSPRIGIAEDPASATAHACMAPFWSKKLGKSGFCGSQGFDRIGTINVRLSEGQAYLSGKAFTVLNGILNAS